MPLFFNFETLLYKTEREIKLVSEILTIFF